MAVGAGRIQDKFGSLDTEAGLSMIDIRAANIHQTTRYARILYDTPLSTYVMASASTGYLSNASVVVRDWVNVTDEWGTSLVPLTHVYHVSTKRITFTVEFRIKPEEYFRIPFLYYNMIYSDFRAVGADAHVFIQMKDTNEILFNDWVHGMNAVEYAYVTPFPATKQQLDQLRPSVA